MGTKEIPSISTSSGETKMWLAVGHFFLFPHPSFHAFHVYHFLFLLITVDGRGRWNEKGKEKMGKSGLFYLFFLSHPFIPNPIFSLFIMSFHLW